MLNLILAATLTFGGAYPLTDMSDTCGVEDAYPIPARGDTIRVEYDVWDSYVWNFTGRTPYARGEFTGVRGERFHGSAVVPRVGIIYKVRLIAVKTSNGMRSCPAYFIGFGK